MIETAGVMPLTGNRDWICLSPKKYSPPHESVYQIANELKVVIQTVADIEWAEKKKKARTLKEPAVIGAVIDLGRCFDLFDSSNIKTLQDYYLLFKSDLEKSDMKFPENKDHPKDAGDKVLRELDCAVIEYMHTVIKEDKKLAPFDSIRASFIEGQPIYPGAGFLDKTHIQVCIINPNCIKGYFLPRKKSRKYKDV